MGKTGKTFLVVVWTCALVVSVYFTMWPDLLMVDGCIIALFAAGVVGMFYAKGD